MNLKEKEDPIYLRLFRRLFFGRGKREEMEEVLENQHEEMEQVLENQQEEMDQVLENQHEEMEQVLENQQEEKIQTPVRLILSNFVANKIAMAGLVVFLALLLMVMILPLIRPLQKSYQEVTQQNVSPGNNLLSVPKKLQGHVAQISVGSTFSVGVSTDGEVYLWGKYGKALEEIPEGMGKVKEVSAGVNHILAINEKGTLFAWGYNRFGQTQIPKEVSELTDIRQIVAGNQYSIVVSSDGRVFFWGNQNLIDFHAELWQGQVNEVAANTSVVLALLKKGQIVVLGKRESAYSDVPEFKRGVVDLAMTSQEAYALDEDGTVYQWGTGTTAIYHLVESDGKAEDKDIRGNKQTEGYEQTKRIEQLVGNEQIEENEGSVQTKEDVKAGENKKVEEIEQTERLIQIEAGRYHVIALSNHGKVYAWGADTYGQTSIPKRVGQSTIKEIYCGYYQNYGVTESGKVLTWGLRGYLLGTDGYGRDLFTRLMSGGRLTMTIGAVAVVIQTLIGIFIGGIAGYYGGKVDNLLMRFTEVVNSLPFLPFAMILSAIIGNKLTEMQRISMIMIVLGVLSWPGMARLVRAQILAEKNKEFVTAAKAMGIRQGRIIFRHILPNVMTYVIVSATASFAASMLTESSLSFLGFGVIEPSPTWGNMLTGSQSSVVIGTYWWRWVFPALALSLATISIYMVGDGLREAIDPKSNESR